MKTSKLIYSLYIVMFILVSCTPSGLYTFTLKGRVADGGDTGSVKILDPQTREVLCATSTSNGTFKLKGKLPFLGQYIIRVGNKESCYLLDGKEMVLTFDKDWGGRYLISGSPAEDLRLAYQKMLRERYTPLHDSLKRACSSYLYDSSIPKKERGTTGYFDRLSDLLECEPLRYNLVKEFIGAHPNSIFSAELAIKSVDCDYDRGKEMHEALSEEIRHSPLGRQLEERFLQYESTAIGKKLPAFPVETLDGEIKDFAWNSGVCVLDFWSSSCLPCRLEFKYMKALHDEFRDKGLNIVSISVDTKPELWKKANDEEEIPWISVRNVDGLESIICKELGFSGIPYYVLLDKEGRIVAKKRLRLNSLRKRVIELLED